MYDGGMPRQARVVVPGCPHHVTQRGNNQQAVFFTEEDRQVYLSLLGEQAQRFGLRVEGYCLMSNHIHLVATPRRRDSLAKAVGRTNLYYTRHINRLHGRRGHLWQDRFFSCALDDEHFWSALVYIERNPVRAKMVRRAWRYAWSSAAAHCALARDKTGLLDLAAWRKRLGDVNWQEALLRAGDASQTEALRGWTNRGCPLGSDRFLAKLEARLGRRLRPLPRGRPRKKIPKDKK